MSRAPRRALRTSDILLSALAYALCWGVAVVVLSVVEEVTWEPGDPQGSALPSWIFAIAGFVPVLVAAVVAFTVPALLLRRGANAGWFLLSFALAGIVAFAVLTLVITRAPAELAALEWGLRQVLSLVLLPAAGGVIAGMVAWRRAKWRAGLPQPTA